MIKPKDSQRLLPGEKWAIYIPEEGHWDIHSVKDPNTKKEAKDAYLLWAGRTTLPRGSFICKVAI